MIKRMIIILVLILSIPSLCLAVKYQVSCNMIFNEWDDFTAVWNYLNSKKSLGFLITNDDGDRLGASNDLRSVNNSSTNLDLDPNMPCRLRFRLRIESERSRDEIYDYLDTVRLHADAKKSSFLEKHTCRWEERVPCTDKEITSWGVTE